MKVRKIGLPGLQELRDIGIKSYVPHYAHLWEPDGVEWYINRCFGVGFLQNELTNTNVEYYIVENDGENIGIMKIVLKKPIPDSDVANALYLEKLYFVKEWTGKGIGKRLIDFALHRSVELNRQCVWLMAMDTSAKPIAAYERAGFTVSSRTRLDDEFKLMKEEFRGMVVMKNCVEKNGS
jgi:GNAT superfamily N-acetyltransferase